MEQYQVTGPSVNVNAGLVSLDPDQARRRKHNIVEIKTGIFNVVKPIQFKKGEYFGYDGDVSRANAELMSRSGKEDDTDGSEATMPAKKGIKKKAAKKGK